jgi:hypothetical protein
MDVSMAQELDGDHDAAQLHHEELVKAHLTQTVADIDVHDTYTFRMNHHEQHLLPGFAEFREDIVFMLQRDSHPEATPPGYTPGFVPTYWDQFTPPDPAGWRFAGMLYPVIQYHPQDPTTIQHPAGLTMLLTNAIQSHLSRDEAAPPSFIPEALSALGYTLMGCGADGSLTQQLTQGIWRGSRYPVTPEFKDWILQGVPREGIGTVWDSLKAAAGPLGHGGKGSAKRAKSSGSAWAASAGPNSWGGTDGLGSARDQYVLATGLLLLLVWVAGHLASHPQSESLGKCVWILGRGSSSMGDAH